MRLTRRGVLLSMAGAGAAGLLPGRPGGGARAAAARVAHLAEYDVPAWTGDHYGAMHFIRDAILNGDKLPTDRAPDRSVDVAIIGGGIAGLVVAEGLKGRDFVLLERESRPGGNAKSGTWHGIEYSEAAAYLATTEGPWGELYRSIGLDLKPVAEPVDMMLTPGGKDGLTGTLKTEFERLRQWFTDNQESPDFPQTDIYASTDKALALDKITFKDWLTAEGYSQAMLNMVDLYCRSALAGRIDTVSAYGGLNFYSEIANHIYALPGGNGAVARALAARIAPDRLRTGAAVHTVTRHGDKYRIHYFDCGTCEASEPGEAELKARTVEARRVVVAAPYYFAARILRELDECKDACARMEQLEYGAYLVANLCFEGRVGTLGYDHWLLGNDPGEEAACRGVSDFVTADWVVPAPRRSKSHSVISAYAPLMDAWGGRALMKDDSDETRRAIAASVVAQVNAYMPIAPTARLREVRLSRLGHQFLSTTPGTICTARCLPKQFGNLLLAHSDGQGMAAIESAIVEAQAALAALDGKADPARAAPCPAACAS